MQQDAASALGVELLQRGLQHVLRGAMPDASIGHALVGVPILRIEKLQNGDVVHLRSDGDGAHFFRAVRFRVGVVGGPEQKRRPMQQALEDALRCGQLQPGLRG